MLVLLWILFVGLLSWPAAIEAASGDPASPRLPASPRAVAQPRPAASLPVPGNRCSRAPSLAQILLDSNGQEILDANRCPIYVN